MKAFVLTRYGGPAEAELREIARPDPGPGEILVKVAAAGLNPVDFKIRQGMLKVIERYPLPIVMGNELSGTVAALGEGVGGFSPGERVFARMPKETMGAFAEYAVVPAGLLASVPQALDLVHAAGVPLAGLTALQALRDELGLKHGSRVLITGGAGGVGTFAVQIAKWLGAEVATTASPRGRELVERMGADIVIDYTSGRFEDRLQDLDAAFDLIGGETLTRCFSVVKRGGTVVSIAGMPEPRTARKDLDRGFPLSALFWAISLGIRIKARRHGVDYRYLFMHPSGPELAELATLAEAGRLTPQIDKVFPFAQIDQAFAYLEAGHAKGKVVVRMTDK